MKPKAQMRNSRRLTEKRCFCEMCHPLEHSRVFQIDMSGRSLHDGHYWLIPGKLVHRVDSTEAHVQRSRLVESKQLDFPYSSHSVDRRARSVGPLGIIFRSLKITVAEPLPTTRWVKYITYFLLTNAFHFK